MNSFLSIEQAELAAKINILVLGGTANFTQMVREQLSGLFAGIDFISLENMTEALAKGQHQILIVELIENSESIFAAIEQALQFREELQVIYLAPKIHPEEIQRAINIGAAGFLTPPVTMPQLRQVLVKILNRFLRLSNIYKNYTENLLSPPKKINYQHQWFLHQLSVDPLTGLFNRIKLNELLQRSEPISLLLINLDDFSQLNLAYGFDFGDAVLRSVANFLENHLPPNSLAFRLQADEFAIVLSNPTPDQEVQLAKEIIESLARLNLQVLEVNIKITCSIGVAKGRGMDLIRQASLALLEARNRGRAKLQVYHSELLIERRQKENLLWINQLKLAFEHNRLFPVFQPILDNRSGKVAKYECLIRMVGNENEIISPYQFLMPAKIAGLLPLVTGAIVEKSFPYLAGNNLHFSINLTEQDFRGLFLVDYLMRKTEEWKIEPKRITLEILEDIDSTALSLVDEQLAKLRAKGFKVAIDDFGVSGSNFSRITELKPDFIKIEGRFVRGIHKDANLQKIVFMIHQIAQSIGSQVIAEFVSSKEDFEFICGLGIEYSQGYYISEPLPASKIFNNVG